MQVIFIPGLQILEKRDFSGGQFEGVQIENIIIVVLYIPLHCGLNEPPQKKPEVAASRYGIEATGDLLLGHRKLKEVFSAENAAAAGRIRT